MKKCLFAALLFCLKISLAVGQSVGNPFAYRNIISPTAFSLRKGEAVWQNTFLFFNDIHVGINDRLSVGFGTVTIPEEIPFWGSAKWSLPVPETRFRMAFGYAFNSWVEYSEDRFHTFYAVGTLGSRLNNVSAGVVQFVGPETVSQYAWFLGGTWRMGRRFQATAEFVQFYHDFVPGPFGFDDQTRLPHYSIGGRWTWRRAAFELAYVGSNTDWFLPFYHGDEPSWFPWVTVLVRFGKRPRD